MKVDFKNCRTETSSSYGTGTFIVIIIEGEYHIQLLESITHNDIIKTLQGKKDYAISEINVSSVKGQAIFPSDNKKKEKYFYIVKQE